MARRYRGHRAADGTGVALIVGEGGGADRPLRPDIGRLGYGWGPKDQAAGRKAERLAVALLADVLGEDDPPRIERLRLRFMHRTTLVWTGDTWSIDAAAVQSMVDDIERVERETAQTRRMVALTPPPPPGNEGGADVKWTRAQMPTPNLPGRK